MYFGLHTCVKIVAFPLSTENHGVFCQSIGIGFSRGCIQLVAGGGEVGLRANN